MNKYAKGDYSHAFVEIYNAWKDKFPKKDDWDLSLDIKNDLPQQVDFT